MSSSIDKLLEAQGSWSVLVGARKTGAILHTLTTLERKDVRYSDSLIRLHEFLLFLIAFPPSRPVLNKAQHLLNAFEGRVRKLRRALSDLSRLDDPEVSGIAGTSVTSNFSYDVVRWLVDKYPKELSIDWDWLEGEDVFGATMPQFLPLLAEDALVEAHVPYRDWLRQAAGRKNEIVWLIDRFESLKIQDAEKARLYDSLKLHVTWQFDFSASRTGMKVPQRRIFFHRTPLIQRQDISLVVELKSPLIPVKKLSTSAGKKILDLSLATSAVRYRELHGFTYGDRREVLWANLGRGVEAFVVGVPPEHRLPLRAYHAAIIFKNGVPVAYFEGLSLFERMESGFNVYYTFREGETAWLFARILRLMHQLLGVTVISIDPYQLGYENEEGIESGAFWFYRKLGFRPVRPELIKLANAEERKIKTNPGHWTSARTLRKLAAGHMLFDTLSPNQLDSEWDRFAVRNIGFAIQRRMSRELSGDANKIRCSASRVVASALGKEINLSDYPKVIEDFASALMLIPDLACWSHEDKSLLARIIDAKAHQPESIYLRLMQEHQRLRAAVIALGSLDYIGASSSA